MASLLEAKKGKEIERRWLVTDIDPTVWESPRHEIEQGYIDTHRAEPGCRIRIVDNTNAILTVKTGAGMERDEEEEPLSLRAGRLLYNACPFKLQKTRFLRDDWEVDRMLGSLKGIIIAEFEMSSVDQAVTLPAWIKSATEVTNSITNAHLAKLEADLAEESAEPLTLRDLAPRRLPRIVLTGGPCSGKSSIMRILQEMLGPKLHCVPEVATILIAQVGIVPPLDQPGDLRRFQRILARVQRDFEIVSEDQARRDKKAALLLDRGVIDNAAYLRQGMTELMGICRSTPEHEYAQYDLVLCLATPPEQVYNANRANNPARFETYDQAAQLGQRIQQVWGGHPNFHVIGNGASWQEKAEMAVRAVTTALRL